MIYSIGIIVCGGLFGILVIGLVAIAALLGLETYQAYRAKNRRK